MSRARSESLQPEKSPVIRRRFSAALDQIHCKKPLSKQTSESALQSLQAEYQQIIAGYHHSSRAGEAEPVQLRRRERKSDRSRTRKARSVCDDINAPVSVSPKLNRNRYSSSNLLGSEFCYFPAAEDRAESEARIIERVSDPVELTAQARRRKLLNLSEKTPRDSWGSNHPLALQQKPSKGPMKKFVSFLKRSFSTSNVSITEEKPKSKLTFKRHHRVAVTKTKSSSVDTPYPHSVIDPSYTLEGYRPELISLGHPDDTIRQFESLRIGSHSPEEGGVYRQRPDHLPVGEVASAYCERKRGKFSVTQRVPVFVL